MINHRRRRFLGQVSSAAAIAVMGGVANVAATTVDAGFRRGINVFPWFSLTRELPAPSRAYAWPPFQAGRPVPTRADLGRLRACGLDFIRLPVDPGPFLAMKPEQVTNLSAMLMAAVEMAIDTGLRVVVNFSPNTATHYWNPQNLMSGTNAPAFEAYLKLISTWAKRLGRFPAGSVALECVNEPPQSCASPVWDKIQAAFLTAARSASPDLILIATGACGSMISGLSALDPRPLEAFRPLIYTFHFYEPYVFSHQGAPWIGEPLYRYLNAVPWPGSAGSLEESLAAVRVRIAQDKKSAEQEKKDAYREAERVLKDYFDALPDRGFIAEYISKVENWGRRHGIAADRILMGEFGALKSDHRYVAAHAADRARYIKDVRLTAEKAGLPWAFWNLFDGMGLIDDTTRAFDPSILDALGLAAPAP